MNGRYTVGSLFSGIGGFDLGFEWAGFHIAWQCEADPFCRAALRKHWPDVPCYKDVRTLRMADADTPRSRVAGETHARRECHGRRHGADSGDRASRVDVLIGGFPCQDVSDAGQRAGLDGDRSGLWFEYLRCIGEFRPRVVVVENVRGLFVRGIDQVLGGLADAGYDAEWATLRASDVGAPHRRERVFIIGVRVDDACGERRQQVARGAFGDESSDEGRRTAHDHQFAGPDQGAREGMAQPMRGRLQGRAVSTGPRREGERTGGAVGASAGRLGHAEHDGLQGVGDASSSSSTGRTEHARSAIAGTDHEDGSMADASGVCQREADEHCAWNNSVGHRSTPGLGAFTRWPSRPGEPQHDWEPPRVIASARAQSAVGALPDGLPAHVAGWRRAALAAIGNAIVPQVAYIVAQRVRCILDGER